MLFGNRSAGVSWLVVGLGNVGDKYENTRHNVGFEVADELAERARVPLQKLKYRALTNTVEIGGEKVLLMKPVTYMNLSGEAVGEAARFFKIPADHVLVLSDDVSLPVGKLRVRRGGLRRGTQRPEEHHPASGHRPVPPDQSGRGREAPPRL